MANVAPRLLGELAAAIAAERPRAEVAALQSRIDELAGIFDQGDWLSGLKCALGVLGWAVGDPSPPVAPQAGAGRATIEAILADPGLARWLTTGPGR